VTPFVIDASALVEYFFRTPRAKTFAPFIESPESDLHVPELADVEFASAAVRLLVRRVATPDRVSEALTDLADLRISRHGHFALLPRMISLRENFSVYDAVYVALAESIGATFVTADDKLATAVRAHTKVRLGAYPSRST